MVQEVFFYLFFVSILSQEAIYFDHLYASYLLNNLVCLSVWTIIHLTVFINGLKSVISLKVEVVDIVKVNLFLRQSLRDYPLWIHFHIRQINQKWEFF